MALDTIPQKPLNKVVLKEPHPRGKTDAKQTTRRPYTDVNESLAKL